MRRWSEASLKRTRRVLSEGDQVTPDQLLSICIVLHLGPEHASRDKKLPMVNFLIFRQMNIYIKGFQKMKIRP